MVTSYKFLKYTISLISDISADCIISEGINDHLLNTFFCWDLISAILAFWTTVYTFPTWFSLVWIQNKKYEILYWYVHNTYMETSWEHKTMGDKMKKKTLVVLIKASHLSYPPPPSLPLFPPYVHVVYILKN